MAEEYFCVKDCVCNGQYFYGGKTYDEEKIFLGLAPGEKPNTSKYLIPLDRDELTDEQEELLRVAAEDAMNLAKTLENFGGGQVSTVRQAETHRQTAKDLRRFLKKKPAKV